jgi:hypothetical protein
MTDSSLSPAAQAVLRADAAARCLSEWDSVNDPPCHPSDGDWNGCIRCVNRSAVAAALRAAVAHTQQHRGLGVWECDADELLAIASELDNNSTH